MRCSVCGEDSAEGRFCTNCGAQLEAGEQTSESSYYFAEEEKTHEKTDGGNMDSSIENTELVDKIKKTASDFWHFFTTLISRPSEAKKANSTDLSSGIIAIVLFSLIIALSYHFIMQSFTMGFFVEVTFLDSFIVPLVIFAFLFFIIAGLTFIGTKLSVQAVTFPDVVAKYGAYLIPFLLAFAAGALLSLLGLPVLAGLLIMVSIFGGLFIAPSFILMEQQPEGFDRIYVLLGLYVMIMLVFSFLTQSFLQMVIQDFIDMLSTGL